MNTGRVVSLAHRLQAAAKFRQHIVWCFLSHLECGHLFQVLCLHRFIYRAAEPVLRGFREKGSQCCLDGRKGVCVRVCTCMCSHVGA